MLANIVDKTISATPPAVLSRVLKKMPRGLIRWKRDTSFNETVKYAYRHSAFYRRKFDELKINPAVVKKPSDLGNFYTTPADIMEHAEDFVCRPAHMVFESSGTTGRNKRIYVGQDELDGIGHLNALGFYLWGMNKNDRLVNAFDFCIWIPGMVTHKGLEKSRLFGMGAGKVDPMEIYKRIPVYNFNVILSEPTWLIKLTEIAEKNGPYPLKLIIGGAEEMPEAARPWMERVWQGASVRMVYASVESAGIMGAEMRPDCRGYHIDENDFLIEIADANEEGYGEVTFTTLNRKTMPLIRYRNRDISKIIDDRCPCGLPYRKLAKMRGRSDELIVASGGNLYPLMFEEIMKDVNGITSDWQVVFKLSGIKEVMELNLELRDGAQAETVKKNIFRNMESRYPDLWKNYCIHIFEIEFKFHPAGALRSGRRKLLRMVDKRYTK